MGRNLPFCRDCRAEIAWATLLPSGKTVPLDLSPDPDLGIYHRTFTTGPDGRKTSTVRRLSAADLAEARDRAHRYPLDPGSKLWIDHRQTCSARRPSPQETP